MYINYLNVIKFDYVKIITEFSLYYIILVSSRILTTRCQTDHRVI